MNKQFLAARLAARYGVRVFVGLHRWIEDVRDPDTGKIVSQIVHDEGEKFTREDGVAIPQADIDAETPAAEADETAALLAKSDRVVRQDALKVEADTDVFIDRLRSATPEQIKTWVQNNVTDLASARAVLGRLAVAVAYALNGGAAK